MSEATLALYDIKATIEEATESVCDELHDVAMAGNVPILARAVAICCRPAFDGDGNEVRGGYVAERGITVHTDDGHQLKVGLGNEVLLRDGIMSVLDPHYGNVNEVVVGHIVSVAFSSGGGHLW